MANCRKYVEGILLWRWQLSTDGQLQMISIQIISMATVHDEQLHLATARIGIQYLCNIQSNGDHIPRQPATARIEIQYRCNARNGGGYT
jgi:hypothetical protein